MYDANDSVSNSTYEFLRMTENFATQREWMVCDSFLEPRRGFIWSLKSEA
jgi:hypothetical protein